MRGILRTIDASNLLAQRDSLQVELGTIHLWSVSLAASEATIARCMHCLSAAEVDRVRRLRLRRDRDEYLVVHGLLRHLLGRYCDKHPADLLFDAAPAGKPSLCATGSSPISFNLSHAGGRAILAVADGRQIGVDLEKLDPQVEPLRIARQYFFGLESWAIEHAQDSDQLETFFRYWVAKEATLKAAGFGLSFPLDGLSIRFSPTGDDADVLSLHPDRLSGDWRVRMLPCEPDWLAAIVAAGSDWAWRSMCDDRVLPRTALVRPELAS